MSFLSKLKSFFSSEYVDETNEDYICSQCPIQKMSYQDLQTYKNQVKVQKYCKKYFGTQVKITQYHVITNNEEKVVCIKKEN